MGVERPWEAPRVTEGGRGGHEGCSKRDKYMGLSDFGVKMSQALMTNSGDRGVSGGGSSVSVLLT